jgi:type II secretory pathway component PulF
MTAPTPLPSAGRRVAVTLLATMPWPMVLFQYLTVLPGYDKLFRDFHLKLNGLTSLMLDVSGWTRRNSLAAFAIVFALTIVSMLTAHTVHLAPMSRRRRATILLFVFGVPCLAFVLTWLGVFVTHRTLVEGLNK